MLFCFCADQKDVAKNIYEVNQELGGGELSLSACPRVGNRPLRNKKIKNPWGVCRGRGMVTSITEPCKNKCCVTDWKLHYEVDVVSRVFRSGIFSNFEGI